MNHLPNLFLDRQGKSKMLGNIQMNENRITGLTNPPNSDDEATNKKYVDENISKSNIKPSHTPKNVFQYLMDDVNEWSTEYNVKVGSINDLPESPHSWDKKVLNITPFKCPSRLERTGQLRFGKKFPFIFCGCKGFGKHVLKPVYFVKFIALLFCNTPKRLQPSER